MNAKETVEKIRQLVKTSAADEFDLMYELSILSKEWNDRLDELEDEEKRDYERRQYGPT